MSNIVFDMLKNGMTDAQVCNELGLEEEEEIRLRTVSGFDKLFAGHEYGKEWKSEQQVKAIRGYHERMRKEGKDVYSRGVKGTADKSDIITQKK